MQREYLHPATNLGMVDELRIVVQPTLLGAGKPLFGGVIDRKALALNGTKVIGDGAVRLSKVL